MAFNAKNLHYDKQEPAFLRRLKGEFGDLDGRHNVQIARPKKDRLKTGDDDEDEPVIVDEQGERIEKAEFERRAKGDDNMEKAGTMEDAELSKVEGGESSEQTERQKVTEIGNAKKRKAVKVVVDGEEEDGNPTGEGSRQSEEPLKEMVSQMTSGKKETVAPKKKAKKIKLSFDEPE